MALSGDRSQVMAAKSLTAHYCLQENTTVPNPGTPCTIFNRPHDGSVGATMVAWLPVSGRGLRRQGRRGKAWPAAGE